MDACFSDQLFGAPPPPPLRREPPYHNQLEAIDRNFGAEGLQGEDHKFVSNDESTICDQNRMRKPKRRWESMCHTPLSAIFPQTKESTFLLKSNPFTKKLKVSIKKLEVFLTLCVTPNQPLHICRMKILSDLNHQRVLTKRSQKCFQNVLYTHFWCLQKKEKEKRGWFLFIWHFYGWIK